MRRFSSSLLGVIAVLAMLVGLNILAETRLGRVQLDLTQQRLYTLNDGTRKIIAGLKDQVTLRLYYSRALGGRVPVYGAYADRIREMLREYASVANGKIKLEFFDPEPFSDTEDRALAYGLQGVPIDQSGEQVYFGLAASNLLDDERSIPFFQPERERFLEFDLTKLIYELSSPTRPVMGALSSLPLDGDPRMMMMMRNTPGAGAPWVSMLQLRQSFTVKNVQPDVQVIDPEIQVLLVAHAQNLSDNALYAIDQFVMRGGRLMAMVDPHSEGQASAPSQTGQPPTNTASDLKKLFDAWGIDYDPKQVVGDLTGAWRVRANPGDRVQSVDYVAWFNIRDGINHEDPATADLTQVTVATAGSLRKKDGADITFTPLLTASPKAGPVDLDKVKSQPNPSQILGTFKSEGGPYVIAARVRGILNSAFAAPPDPPREGKRPDNFPAHIAKTAEPANLVIAADSDILADRFWVRLQDFFGQQEATPFSDNGAFVANLVGTLAGGDALIGLRSRGTSLRPFAFVDGMQRDAEARYRQTERELQAHLDETQKKLTTLRTGRGDAGAAAVISEQQRNAIDDLRKEVTTTRVKLRNVQLELRRDIISLESRLRMLNIIVVPTVLAILAIGLGVIRRRQRAAARA